MIFLKPNIYIIERFLSRSVIKHHSNKINESNVISNHFNHYIFDWFLIKSIIIVTINYLKNLINFFNNKPFYVFEVANVEVGKYVTSTTMRNVRVNNNFFLFFYRFHKNLVKSFFYYAAALRITKKADAIFLGDIFYLDGIILDFFLPIENIDVYLKIDPYNLVCVTKQYKNLQNFFENGFRDSRRLVDSNKKVNSYMEKRLKNPRDTIYYYDVNSQNYKIKKNAQKKINIIVYVHSFTDTQMQYGYDSFKNIYDWLRYTLKTINKYSDVSVFVKVHPNMYIDRTASGIEEMDLSVWWKLKKHIHSDIQVIDKTINNYEFLKFFDKKNTILISHHGNALVEGAYLGYKVIGSYSALWFDNYSFINIWKNKKNYSSLLNQACTNFENLIWPDESVLQFIQDCYLRDFGSYSKNAFPEIISKYTGISVKELVRNPDFEYNYKIENVIIKSIEKSIEII